MSIQGILESVFNSTLSNNEKLVYLFFYQYKEECSPGYRLISQKIGISKDTVRKSLMSLAQKGHIHTITQGPGKRNIYRLMPIA